MQAFDSYDPCMLQPRPDSRASISGTLRECCSIRGRPACKAMRRSSPLGQQSSTACSGNTTALLPTCSALGCQKGDPPYHTECPPAAPRSTKGYSCGSRGSAWVLAASNHASLQQPNLSESLTACLLLGEVPSSCWQGTSCAFYPALPPPPARCRCRRRCSSCCCRKPRAVPTSCCDQIVHRYIAASTGKRLCGREAGRSVGQLSTGAPPRCSAGISVS